jgi:hypothetical protein
MPHFELLLPYEIFLFFPEAQAAEETQTSDVQTTEAQVPGAQTQEDKEKPPEETSPSPQLRFQV